MKASALRQFGALLSKGAFTGLKRRLDPEVYGGAVLLGLDGVVIKAHGSSRERAIASAIRVAAEEIGHGINKRVEKEIAAANAKLAAAAPAASVNA
jgi:glycerol-3-phosphate acyltransferase PlsX